MNVINIYDNYESNFINIYNFKNKIYSTKYKNKKFIIEPKISFNNCSINNKNNIYSMRIELDLKNIEHIQFKKFINNIYNEISTCIELDNNIENVFQINNPLKSNSSNSYYLYVTINKSTKIINYENDEEIGLNDINNKLLICYPIFYSPNINITNEIGYINFSLYKVFVKIISDTNNTDIKYEPDRQNIINAMNKY